MVAALLAALVACGRSPSTHTAHNAKGSKSGKTVSHSSEDSDLDMVSAVSPGGSNTPISMKFRVVDRPLVGTPVQIEVQLIPAPSVEIAHIHAVFQAGDGLQIQSDRILDVVDPQTGVALEQQLTVLPQQAGVLSLTATVVVDLDSGSIARSYTIPLIARDGAS
jgi:hypothetical protein